MAELGWIDFSPAHRRRVGAILQALGEQGMVDELGIGIVRDALADEMLPGISTIQTRAKYFFLVPYLLYDYQLLSAVKRAKHSPEEFMEKRENEVMWDLGDKYEHKENTGVIGITKQRGQKIVRRPSAVYWNGLGFYGFIRNGGLGVDTFLQQCRFSSESLRADVDGDDTPKDLVDAEHENVFKLHLAYDKTWKDSLTMDLKPEEAKQLADRMRQYGENMLVGELITNQKLRELFISTGSFSDFARAAQKLETHQAIKQILIIAHDFSELMCGAHIAYNCQVQAIKFKKPHYKSNWENWAKSLKTTMLDYDGFTPEKIFSHAPNIRVHTRRFVADWWNYIKSEKLDTSRRDALIAAQERRNKKGRARIYGKRIDDVHEEKWIGLGHLEYRKPQAARILKDIFEGRR